VTLTCLDLFSGIGGPALGFQRAGIETTAFCEIDPYCVRILNKNFPDVPVYGDIAGLTGKKLTDDGIAIPDIIAGGFPCQDISEAGSRSGLRGERSGLWFQYLRLIDELRPRMVVAENVEALRDRGLDEVLWGLDSIRYDAEWHCIPACAVGAPHIRDRIWVMAYPRGLGLQGEYGKGFAPGDAFGGGYVQPRRILTAIAKENWTPEPRVARVADGIPNQVDRIKTLGNASLPQISEQIGHAVVKFLETAL
jgi:DNA (cytosine-5)-methyltransferase 1